MLPYLQILAVATCDKHTFFGLVPWYQYLDIAYDTATGTCDFTNVTSSQLLGNHSTFLLIGLAILEDLIRVAALIAVGYIIFGGIQYITSQGAPDSTKKAQQTIINALVGVGIAIVAASAVAYIGRRLAS